MISFFIGAQIVKDSKETHQNFPLRKVSIVSSILIWNPNVFFVVYFILCDITLLMKYMNLFLRKQHILRTYIHMYVYMYSIVLSKGKISFLWNSLFYYAECSEIKFGFRTEYIFILYGWCDKRISYVYLIIIISSSFIIYNSSCNKWQWGKQEV